MTQDQSPQPIPDRPGAVRVCPIKDSVCGDRPAGWCTSCPNLPAASDKPIDMVLHCPACGLQHIDRPNHWADESAPCDPPNSEMCPESAAECDRQLKAYEAEWTNPPHRSHLCAGCGHIWRPADVPTNGVKAVLTKGQADSPVVAPVRAQGEPVTYWDMSENALPVRPSKYDPEEHPNHVPLYRAAVPTVPAEWKAAVQEFVDRVERGEVRSQRTYIKFKALLAGEGGAR